MPDSPHTADIVEKLLRREEFEDHHGQLHPDELVNPDGPEAAAEIKALREVLQMWRGLINEGDVPRYTITPGAALNTLVTWTDAALKDHRKAQP